MDVLALLDIEDEIKQILDTPISELEGCEELSIRVINKLEVHLECMYIRDLLDVTERQMRDIRGLGDIEIGRLKDCLYTVQDRIDKLCDRRSLL